MRGTTRARIATSAVAAACSFAVLAGCSTADKDVQVQAANQSGVSAVYAATHGTRIGSRKSAPLIAGISTYVAVNRKIGFNWSSQADDATRREVLAEICAADGITSVKNQSGNDLCGPR